MHCCLFCSTTTAVALYSYVLCFPHKQVGNVPVQAGASEFHKKSDYTQHILVNAFLHTFVMCKICEMFSFCCRFFFFNLKFYLCISNCFYSLVDTEAMSSRDLVSVFQISVNMFAAKTRCF